MHTKLGERAFPFAGPLRDALSDEIGNEADTKKTTKRSSKHYCLSYTGISLEWFNFVIQFRVLISIITYDTVMHRRLDSMRSTNCIFMIMIMWAE